MAQSKTPRFYPVHPTAGPVSPAKLNTHLRLLVDNDADAQTAFQAMFKPVSGEIPVGAVDGVNKLFVLGKTPRPALSLQLYDNGVLQYPVLAFSLVNNQITFVTAPMAGHNLISWYTY